jgi:hypothetical protein
VKELDKKGITKKFLAALSIVTFLAVTGCGAKQTSQQEGLTQESKNQSNEVTYGHSGFFIVNKLVAKNQAMDSKNYEIWFHSYNFEKGSFYALVEIKNLTDTYLDLDPNSPPIIESFVESADGQQVKLTSDSLMSDVKKGIILPPQTSYFSSLTAEGLKSKPKKLSLKVGQVDMNIDLKQTKAFESKFITLKSVYNDVDLKETIINLVEDIPDYTKEFQKLNSIYFDKIYYTSEGFSINVHILPTKDFKTEALHRLSFILVTDQNEAIPLRFSLPPGDIIGKPLDLILSSDKHQLNLNAQTAKLFISFSNTGNTIWSSSFNLKADKASQVQPNLIVSDITQQPEKTDIEKLRFGIENHFEFKGVADSSTSFTLSFDSFDTASGQVTGQLSWEDSGGLTYKVKGVLNNETLTFKESEYINKADGSTPIGADYGFTSDNQGRMVGIWKNDSSGNNGKIWFSIK